MSEETGWRKRSIVDLLALILAFVTATVSFFGALFTYVTEAQIAGVSLWPLPGLVLVDWILVGVLGFFATYFRLRRRSKRWLVACWVFSGAFIPLVILGAFSIGFMVLITFLLSLLATSILAFRNGTNWLESFGALMLGSIGNLAILMLVISLSGQTL
jgi:hypothetical protein